MRLLAGMEEPLNQMKLSFGTILRNPFEKGYTHKNKILSLVDRQSGEARSVVIDDVTAKTIVTILKENIAREAKVMTDDAGQYHYILMRISPIMVSSATP